MATVVVIDDDRDMTELVESVLTRAGHKVTSSTDGEHADALVERALESTAGRVILITDIYMPGHDGLEITERIKRMHPEVGVLAISGGTRTGSGYLSAARAYGADLTLPKPFRPIELRAAVEELVR